MIQEPLDVLAALLVVMGVVNLYFVWYGYRLYAAVSPRSSLLLAMFGVKITVWLVGAFVGYIALRVLLDQSPLPFNGIGVAVAILALELLPFFIWTQMRHFVGEARKRNEARDGARDLDRDPSRDDARDLVRDPGRDAGRDEVRDPARDEARDSEHAEGAEMRDEVRHEARDAGRDEARDAGRDPVRDLARDEEHDEAVEGKESSDESK